VYHKLYNQLYSHSTVAKGAKFEAKVIVICAAAETAEWKDKARALAKQMQNP
jgi:CRISPR/Cas system CSM-associated protein Csm3 (group 7 of RAMP superfamily)